MALGELTRLAQQAIKTKDALRPGDQPPAAESVCATILGQVQAMQKALKDDEELAVYCGAVRVMEFIVPTWQVMVLSGIDAEKNVARVVAAADTVQLVCKVIKAAGGAKPHRIAFVAPKPPAK
jgi:hypothetical protein